MTKIINTRPALSCRFFATMAMLFCLAVGVPVALASDPVENSAEPIANAALARREMERHEAKAKDYEIHAYTHRVELEVLWARFEKERRTIAVLPKMVGENPHVKKLRAETEREAAYLTVLAREAEANAQYHRMRAREWAVEQERIASNKEGIRSFVGVALIAAASDPQKESPVD